MPCPSALETCLQSSLCFRVFSIQYSATPVSKPLEEERSLSWKQGSLQKQHAEAEMLPQPHGSVANLSHLIQSYFRAPLPSPHTGSTFGCAVEWATFIVFGSRCVPLLLCLESIFLAVWWMGGGVRTAVFIEGQLAVRVWIVLCKGGRGKHSDGSVNRSWTNLSDKRTRRKERQASGSGRARDEFLHL